MSTIFKISLYKHSVFLLIVIKIQPGIGFESFMVYVVCLLISTFFFLIFLCQLDININPHLPSEYINYLENPMEIINEAEKSAEEDIWSLMQFTENLRRQYGKEPYSMEVLLKKLYVKRMAADLAITRIYASGKTVIMKTKMNKKVFKLVTDSMTSDIIRSSLVFEENQIKVFNYTSLSAFSFLLGSCDTHSS